MTFGEWIDIFTFKKKIDDDFEFNGLNDVLIDLYYKEDNEYFSRFIFYLFNYKNWFNYKKARKPKKNPKAHLFKAFSVRTLLPRAQTQLLKL